MDQSLSAQGDTGQGKVFTVGKGKKRLLYCGKILNYLLLIGVGLLFVYPFAWMFSMSLRPLIEALSFDPNLWVSDPQWSNYIYAWNQAQLSHYVGNSVKYSILVIGLQYFTIIPAAYGFAMMEFRGKKVFVVHKILGHDVTRRSHAHSRVLLLQQDGFSG